MKKVTKIAKQKAVTARVKSVAKPANKVVPAKSAKTTTKVKPAKGATTVAVDKPVTTAVGTTDAASSAAENMPKKLKFSKEETAKFRKLLLELRDHLIDGVNFLASDNLKRSNREVSGDLSGYSLHMADAGTDNFDREFALSLVSNEQDALYEIEEAIKRLESSTYGLCEICEKAIRKERLEAVPFARKCVQCQSVAEKDRRRPAPVTGIFNETADEEGEEKEESEE